MTLSSKAGLSLLISMLLFAVLTALVFAGVLEFRFEYTDPVNGILLGALFCTVYLTVFLLLNIRGEPGPLLPEESPEPYGPIAAAPQAKGPLGSRMEPAVPPKAADPSQGFLFYRPFSQGNLPPASLVPAEGPLPEPSRSPRDGLVIETRDGVDYINPAILASNRPADGLDPALKSLVDSLLGG